ncbi:MAG TPA: translation initiation factor IF-2 N-terminal domain-containing protein, partial [Candidatus Methylomirabilis sp.]
MVRIYDLATAFRLTTKEVLERLHAGGIEALTFSSTVDEERAREILSQPMARIAAHAIRPGTGAAAKPPARKSARGKSATGGEAAEVAPKRQPRAKSATGGEGKEKEEPKPRAPRKRSAASTPAKPLVVTLDAPTLEHAPAPPVEV